MRVTIHAVATGTLAVGLGVHTHSLFIGVGVFLVGLWHHLYKEPQ